MDDQSSEKKEKTPLVAATTTVNTKIGRKQQRRTGSDGASGQMPLKPPIHCDGRGSTTCVRGVGGFSGWQPVRAVLLHFFELKGEVFQRP